MAKASTRQVTCKLCFKGTSVPTSNPPFGSHLICTNCHMPLVSTITREGATPLSVSPEALRRVMGFSGRCLIHAFCPWCSEINYGIVAPAEGRSTPWCEQKEPQNPGSFSLKTDCVHCSKEFYVEWDEAPLPANCALCRLKMQPRERSSVDPRFCTGCAPKLSQVRARRKGDEPPGSELRCVFLAGFSRTPTEREVKALRSLDREIGRAPVAQLMLSGGVPGSRIETAMIAVDLAESAVPKAVGHKVDLKKVSYQFFRNMLLVKIWS